MATHTYIFERKDGTFPLPLDNDLEAIETAENYSTGLLHVTNESTGVIVWKAEDVGSVAP